MCSLEGNAVQVNHGRCRGSGNLCASARDFITGEGEPVFARKEGQHLDVK